MRRRLAILCIIVWIGSRAWTQVPRNGSDQKQKPQWADNQSTGLQPFHVAKQEQPTSKVKEQGPDTKSSKYPWREFLAPANVPNEALVLVGFGGIIFALLTLRAIKKQADIARAALISSFRPRVVLRSIRLNPPNIAEYQVANNGEWKIEFLLVNTGSTKATVETCQLDLAVIKDNPIPRIDKPQHFCTKKWESFVVPAGGRHPLELMIPYEAGFAITFDLVVQNLSSPYSSGQQQTWPICYGTIIYTDDNGHKRQTGFHRRWNILAERFEASDDQELEYED
jgi:hypothetical protein